MVRREKFVVDIVVIFFGGGLRETGKLRVRGRVKILQKDHIACRSHSCKKVVSVRRGGKIIQLNLIIALS